MSSKFLGNNIENLIILGLAIVKVLLFKIIFTILPARARKIIGLKINMILIILTEGIALIPFFLISAQVNIMMPA